MIPGERVTTPAGPGEITTIEVDRIGVRLDTAPAPLPGRPPSTLDRYVGFDPAEVESLDALF